MTLFVWILPGTSPPRALAGVVLAPADVMWSNLLCLELRKLLMSYVLWKVLWKYNVLWIRTCIRLPPQGSFGCSCTALFRTRPFLGHKYSAVHSHQFNVDTQDSMLCHFNNISTILTADSDHDNHLSCPWPSRTTPQSDKVPETLVCGTIWRGGIVVTTHMGHQLYLYWFSYILAITHIGYHIYWSPRILGIIHIDYHTQRDV